MSKKDNATADESKVVASADVIEEKDPVIRVGKDAIYERLGAMIKEMTGKRVGLAGGRKVFDEVIKEFFVEATKEGTFRFNGGFGSLHVKTYQAGERRLPSGQTTTFGERQKLRYEEGVVVAGLVAHKGDYAKVQADRAAEAANPTAAGAVDPAPGDAAEGDVDLG